MGIIPNEDLIELYSDAFDDEDILERKKVSSALSAILNRMENPVVIALDGEWGSGKTYFLKRWVTAHTTENSSDALTVYFDAFANDCLDDPLPGLVSALNDRMKTQNGVNIKRLKTAAFKALKPILKIGLRTVTFGAKEELDELGDVAAEASRDEALIGLDKFWDEQSARIDAIREFKKTLEDMTTTKKEGGNPSPLIFVVDELDRCRPDYALSLLEIIKHFFSVPNVHFVLGVNMNALELSVKSRYGSEIDAKAYLKKFVQITTKLPEDISPQIYSKKPTQLVYFDRLCKDVDLPEHIYSPLRENVQIVSTCNTVTLRDIQDIINHLSLAKEDLFNDKNFSIGKMYVIFDLIISKIVRPDLYLKFLSANISPNELVSYFGSEGEWYSANPSSQMERKIYFRYQAWIFLTGNDALLEENPQLHSHMQKIFDVFGDEDLNAMPEMIHNRYLNQFHFYGT